MVGHLVLRGGETPVAWRMAFAEALAFACSSMAEEKLQSIQNVYKVIFIIYNTVL